jgi:hypothetical protein
MCNARAQCGPLQSSGHANTVIRMRRGPPAPTYQRPHVVILGAGASLAALPTGDRHSRPLPLMTNLVELVGLEPLLRDAGVEWEGLGFEELYSRLAADGGHSALLRSLEDEIRAYFAVLQLPEQPSLYDHLVLSLREKDFIATFNWDPLLWQALRRCRKFAPVPQCVALHGSVALGYCGCGQPVMFGDLGLVCERCGNPLQDLPILFPVEQKDYQSNPLIAAAWHDLQMVLRRAFALTIFGYGGPRTDAAALELMRLGWGTPDTRRFEELEVIDVKAKTELEATWAGFIHSHHWGAYRSLYDSYLLQRWPRRSCEGLFNAVMQNNPDPDNWLPADADWPELERFLQPLVSAERSARE